ncbi:MAG: helicase-associated domain-containing protein, partial [Gemmatimonadetes bacterium]|nr:helicase-associated domain-containing protein [Gemmatimonadota bacterium]
MAHTTDKPLIVQSDHSLLLEVGHPSADEAREAILPFAELLKSPEHVHTYRISPLSLWNASASGLQADEVLERLEAFSRFPIPPNLSREIRTQMDRYGLVELLPEGDGTIGLVVRDERAAQEVFLDPTVAPFLLDGPNGDPTHRRCKVVDRGEIKIALTKIGFPARDLVGFEAGADLAVSLGERLADGREFGLRGYQRSAVEAFWQNGSPEGGQGIVVLPCGAGKTVVGIGAMVRAGVSTLILATNTVAAKQWIREILDKTSLRPQDVGEYDGTSKDVRPVTVATYQILVYRRKKDGGFPHMEVFRRQNWG